MLRRTPVLLTAPILLLALAGCTASAPAPSAPSTVTATVTTSPSASASTPAATSSAPASASSAPAASPSASSASADSGAPAGQCADSALTVSFGQGDGGAGSDYVPVVFTNTGSTSCVLRGAPGVSVVGGNDGTQLGQPADRDQSNARDVTLDAHGGRAHATLALVNIGTNGGPLPNCSVVTGDGYRVYPPHSTRAYFVRERGAPACKSGVWMHVGVVASGAGGGK